VYTYIPNPEADEQSIVPSDHKAALDDNQSIVPLKRQENGQLDSKWQDEQFNNVTAISSHVVFEENACVVNLFVIETRM